MEFYAEPFFVDLLSFFTFLLIRDTQLSDRIFLYGPAASPSSSLAQRTAFVLRTRFGIVATPGNSLQGFLCTKEVENVVKPLEEKETYRRLSRLEIYIAYFLIKKIVNYLDRPMWEALETSLVKSTDNFREMGVADVLEFFKNCDCRSNSRLQQVLGALSVHLALSDYSLS